MNTPTYRESLLLVQFRTFYSEVVRLKQEVNAGTLPHPSEEDLEGWTEPAKAGSRVRQRLLFVLEQLENAAARRVEEYGSAVFEEARYVMAALADEIFLHMDWDARAFWSSNLLESKLFGSHGAGEMFFQKLDRLLQTRDPGYTELAKVYLLALAMGFEGKYRGSDDVRDLDGYRRKIFSYIVRREPDMLDESKRLFPEAYAYTLDEGTGQRLPDIRRWIGLLVLVILILIVIGHGVWVTSTAQLNQVIHQILGRS